MELHYNNLLDQLHKSKRRLSDYEQAFIEGRMYELELMMGVILSSGKKLLDKEEKARIKSKTPDEIFKEDPLRYLMLAESMGDEPSEQKN